MGRSADFIPLGFILGFYVTQVVNRWWGQYNSIVWPDTLALNLMSFMPGRQVRQQFVYFASKRILIMIIKAFHHYISASKNIRPSIL